MNILENKMLDLLQDLRDNYNVIGIKAEFEDEGCAKDEVLRLKELGLYSGLDLCVKIGGCGALKDMLNAKLIGAGLVVAPMIESPYAVKKYIQTIKNVFDEPEITHIKFYINIESIYGYNCIDEILNSDFSKYISGIVFGRTDMVSSLGLDNSEINNPILLEFGQNLAKKAKKYSKEFIIGGGVTDSSIEFFNSVAKIKLDKFETRKIIFDIQALQKRDLASGIMKALEFELLWLKNKQQNYRIILEHDTKRLISLDKKYQMMMDKCYV